MWFNPTTSGNHGSMAKREPQKQSAQATLAEIIEEMDKPRVAMSAREDHAVQRPFLKQRVLSVRLRKTAINGWRDFAPVSGCSSRASIPQGWRQALRCAAAVQ